ncbi:MAG: HAD family hydrolase [Gammaproteobacteria bacterium]|nr:HAD family hydrolase [Gammaproteobacteria bacterium]MCP5458112.1 HAD family hydrolase [Gammaproteobacteria bacterium]
MSTLVSQVRDDSVFALDFDGVLCDSAAESAVSAWRAGCLVWPEWRGAEPPAECLRHFRLLRPVIETGYQTVLLMRLIWLGRQTDEDLTNDFQELSETLLKTLDRTPTELVELFGQERDRWIASDPNGWYERQRFYPEIIEAFRHALNQGAPVYILTTKQERFVKVLLQKTGFDFPEDRILGLERNRPKEAMLEYLLRKTASAGATLHFVEDRLATLLRVIGQSNLDSVRLYLAEWGYNTARERRIAWEHPRIMLWNIHQFLQVK